MARDLPSLNAVRVFEAAARHLNFSRAADELSVTQSAVSRQIKVLEEQLGRPLFRRSGPVLSLTSAGAMYPVQVAEAKPEPAPAPYAAPDQEEAEETMEQDLPASFESQAVGATETSYSGAPMTISLKDGDIKDVLRSFAQISGLNVVVQPGVSGTVTVEPLEAA